MFVRTFWFLSKKLQNHNLLVSCFHSFRRNVFDYVIKDKQLLTFFWFAMTTFGLEWTVTFSFHKFDLTFYHIFHCIYEKKVLSQITFFNEFGFYVKLKYQYLHWSLNWEVLIWELKLSSCSWESETCWHLTTLMNSNFAPNAPFRKRHLYFFLWTKGAWGKHCCQRLIVGLPRPDLPRAFTNLLTQN